MIKLIFTIDYEIFGNGEGSLKKLLYEPTKELLDLFDEYNYKFVNFVEVAELIKIKKYKSDNYLSKVEDQIRAMHKNGHEIGLHIHPQWFNASFNETEWNLDYNEENLCNLRKDKIDKYIKASINYLKHLLGEKFQPISFRAGGWMIQPTKNIAPILSKNGIKVDSSVFKGGVSHYYGLDFKEAIKNGYYWSFSDDVNTEDIKGKLIEVPIYTKMVFPWKMLSKNRVKYSVAYRSDKNISKKILGLRDKLRVKYPKKFDFTKMIFKEFKSMTDEIISRDRITPKVLKPIVLIGHAKNLPDIQEIRKMLIHLQQKGIQVSSFKEIIQDI